MRAMSGQHPRPAPPLAAFTTEDGSLWPHRTGGQSKEVVLHRAQPEELWDQTAVGITSRLHPGRDLELIDQLGEGRSVDVGDDHEQTPVATVLAIEPDRGSPPGGRAGRGRGAGGSSRQSQERPCSRLSSW